MRKRSQQTKGITVLPPVFIEFVKRRYDETLGVLFLLIAGYLGLALGSYDHADPSWNTAVDGAVHNLGGAVGAILSDILIQFFGGASLALIIILLTWSWIKFCHKKISRLAIKLLLVPFLLIMISITFSCFMESKSGVSGLILYPKIQNILPVISPWYNDHIIGGISFVLALGVFFFILSVPWEKWKYFWKKNWNIIYSLSAPLGNIFNWINNLVTKKTPSRIKKKAKVDFGGSSPLQKTVKAHSQPAMAKFDVQEPFSLNPTVPSSRELKNFDNKEEEEEDLNLLPLELNSQEDYQLPPLELLSPNHAETEEQFCNQEALEKNAQELSEVLNDFGIKGKIINVRPGPVVTLYELMPAPGIKSSRVIGLADDIARSMSAISARVAVIPGRNAIGIEMPNDNRQTVFLRELLASSDYERSAAGLALVLGKDISGRPVIADLARMPHLLVAGTTGSGKSVGINSMILSLIYRLPPERCKLIMIDPKMLELSVYDDIPHLLTPVVTDPKKAVVALKWAVREMEDRYRAMSKLGVRNVMGYNHRIAEAKANGEILTREVQTGFDPDTGKPIHEIQPLELEPLPFIVIVVDEMADLMLVAGKDIEAAVQRLAQMARAAGIHLIMATQRPSVDVITGTIKANFPTRISFQVTSKIDSRTILGEQGAEQLLGQGDMLYMAPGGRVTRVHGPFVTDFEVEKVVQFLKSQGVPSYIDDVTKADEEIGGNGIQSDGSGDELYDQAVALVLREKKASTSFIQRYLQIGYNRAARLIEKMEKEGIVSPANRTGKREILIK